MTDSMLWLNGKTVLSTPKRAITNEFLRAQGISVIELHQDDVQKVWQAAQSRFPVRQTVRSGAADRD